MRRVWLAPLAVMGALVATSAAATDEAPANMEDRLRAQLVAERAEHRQQVRDLRVTISQRDHRYRTVVAGLRRTALAKRSVDHAIRLAAVSTGVPYRTLRNVAFCESRLDPGARNRTPIYNGEHAQGLFQFIPSTWRAQTLQGAAGWSIYDAYANAMGAAQLIQRDGLRQWACQADGIAP